MGETLEFQKDEWCIHLTDNIVRLGITYQLQEDIGKIKGATFSAVGSYILENDIICELDAENFNSRLASPVEGEVLEINERALRNPETLNSKNPQETWLLLVRLTKKIHFLDN